MVLLVENKRKGNSIISSFIHMGFNINEVNQVTAKGYDIIKSCNFTKWTISLTTILDQCVYVAFKSVKNNQIYTVYKHTFIHTCTYRYE